MTIEQSRQQSLPHSVEQLAVEQLIVDLHAHQVQLWVEDGRLRYKAPQGAITPTLREAMVANKDALLAHALQATAQQQDASIQPVPRVGDLPLSFSQQRFWFFEKLEGANAASNIPVAWSLHGQLNRTALEESIAEIVRRHEILRTTFRTVGEQPVQVIHPAASRLAESILYTVVDLQALPPMKQQAEVAQLTEEAATYLFDLTTGPLVRIALLQLAEDECLLLLTMHHIIADGWSLDLFQQEWAALYAAFLHGNPSPLEPLAIQYGDFAHWQQERLQGEGLQQQVEYWRQRLADAPPLHQLPTDRPRPAQQSFHGQTVQVEMATDLTQQLRQLSQAHGTTLYMTMLAAFQLLLHRYSGQEDLIIGSPIAGRNRQEVEPLIGYFSNTLALRVNFAENPTFLDLLAQVRQVAQDAYEHQDLPFERLVEEVQPERNLNYAPIFQILFGLQTMQGDVFTLPELTVTQLEAGVKKTHWDLAMHFWETESALKGGCIYNTDIFDEATIQQMMGHFQVLLAGIVADPQQRVSELPLLTATERHQILVEWNETAADYSQDKCIHHLVEEQAARTPDAIAIIVNSDKVTMNEGQETSELAPHLTYRELNERASQLAHHLQSLGVVPGADVRVGLCVERSLEMVVGVLGILKAGGIYVPLDPTDPTERRAYMVGDAQLALILVQEKTAQLVLAESHLVRLDTDWPTISQQPVTAAPNASTSTEMAYVIYTSGSTGKPKGVMGHQRGVANFFQYLISTYNLTSSDVVLQLPTLTFDASLRDLLCPLTVGAQVVLVESENARNPQVLLDAIRTHGVTCLLSIVPTLLTMLIEGQEKEAAPYETIRLVLTSGEPLYHATCRQARALFSPATVIVNQYGPTESTMTSTYYPVSEPGQEGMALAGRPIQNCQLYLLDAHLNPVPAGAIGELYIGGVGITHGYLNQPDQTEKAFVPNPFANEIVNEFVDDRSQTLYKTGDLARYRLVDDGPPLLEFLGRVDHQVKIRGFRVELGEIETLLAQIDGVEQVAVVVRGDGADKQIVAYLVSETAPDDDSLRSYLAATLPDYMIPSVFVRLDAMPLTSSGKIDRRALPEPNTGSKQVVPPQTPTETLLASIWQDVLEIEQIGRHDNFFQIGGHSLLATKAVTRIRERFQIKVPLRMLFDLQTLDKLAEAIAIMELEEAESRALDEILSNIDGLSDEEVEKLLVDA